MDERTALDNAKLGVKYRITEVIDSPWKNKMYELGLLPGHHIELVYVAPLGDPLAVELDGSVISLRKSEAGFILLAQNEEENI
jgi:ferrous iron transport protein A